NTMLRMTKRNIIPAVEAYCADLADGLNAKKSASPALKCKYETDLIAKLSDNTDKIYTKSCELEKLLSKLDVMSGDVIKESAYIRDKILPKMEDLRTVVDESEDITSKEYWPYPSYGDILFSVK
ncbi:MAG: glutamine synthetase type III, partial [Clostridiales bacterium]|nr:glutamine synthetase type III [Clostridiales bacterium]